MIPIVFIYFLGGEESYKVRRNAKLTAKGTNRQGKQDLQAATSKKSNSQETPPRLGKKEKEKGNQTRKNETTLGTKPRKTRKESPEQGEPGKH
jgi:hypothetical protein